MWVVVSVNIGVGDGLVCYSVISFFRWSVSGKDQLSTGRSDVVFGAQRCSVLHCVTCSWKRVPNWVSVVCETLPCNFQTTVFWSHGYCFCRAYNVTLNIGQPQKPYFLDPDTGSDLTWLQCDAPCVRCLEVTEVQFIVKTYTALLVSSSELMLNSE